MKTILFVCVHNAGRSQMAAAWFDERLVAERWSLGADQLTPSTRP